MIYITHAYIKNNKPKTKNIHSSIQCIMMSIHFWDCLGIYFSGDLIFQGINNKIIPFNGLWFEQASIYMKVSRHSGKVTLFRQ